MSHDTGVAAALEEQTCVEKLAQLFPHASPVRISVCLMSRWAWDAGDCGSRLLSSNLGPRTKFSSGSNLPLEFEDRIQLVNSDGSLDVPAIVVAVRYHGGCKAVAARFACEVENWIIKP